MSDPLGRARFLRGNHGFKGEATVVAEPVNPALQLQAMKLLKILKFPEMQLRLWRRR